MSAPLGRLRDLAVSSHQADLTSAYQQLKVLPTAPDFEGIATAGVLLGPSATEGSVAVSGLIVEMREHWNLIHVVKRVITQLGIPVTLVHSAGNRDFILASRFVKSALKRGKLHLVELGLSNINRAQYNALLMSENLWGTIFPARQVLVFQTDSTICSSSPYSLKSFESIDYVGSFMRNPRPTGLEIAGGNGGLSLRNVSRTLEAIRLGMPEHWPGGEDDYFGAHIELFGGTVAEDDMCKRFSSQTVFEERSFGVHNIGGLARKDFARIVLYCPDAVRCHRGALFGWPLAELMSRFRC